MLCTGPINKIHNIILFMSSLIWWMRFEYSKSTWYSVLVLMRKWLYADNALQFFKEIHKYYKIWNGNKSFRLCVPKNISFARSILDRTIVYRKYKWDLANISLTFLFFLFIALLQWHNDGSSLKFWFKVRHKIYFIFYKGPCMFI